MSTNTSESSTAELLRQLADRLEELKPLYCEGYDSDESERNRETWEAIYGKPIAQARAKATRLSNATARDGYTAELRTELAKAAKCLQTIADMPGRPDVRNAATIRAHAAKVLLSRLESESAANLALIAAAPELLAALQFIVNDTPRGPGEDAELTVTGYNLACAAIAKARGGAAK